MGRIVAPLTIKNLADPTHRVRCEALVDAGAHMLTLPYAWRDRLGDLEVKATVDLQTATQETVKGEVCGAVRIQIEGFREVLGEVLFIDMKPEDGMFEPLIGYTTLELSHAAVDMVGHRLLHVARLDLR